MTGPSPAQYYSTVSASLVSSLLSLAGSSAVIICSSRHRDSLDSVYQRLVLNLSLADALSSCANIFHPFLLPRQLRDTAGLLWASGNETTCSVAGFFFALWPTLVSFLSLYLSYYFYLKVAYNLQDDHIHKYYLRPANMFAVILCFGLATAGVAIKGFAPRVYHNICFFGDCEIGKLDE